MIQRHEHRKANKKAGLRRAAALLVALSALCGPLAASALAYEEDIEAIKARQAAILAERDAGRTPSREKPEIRLFDDFPDQDAPLSERENTGDRGADDESRKSDIEATAPSLRDATGVYTEKMLEWKSRYPDVVGYLHIDGTNIDHPVVQGETNDYYTHLDIDKRYSKNGVIWADQEVTAESRNKVLYGHNWTNYSATPRIGDPNDVMFAQLTAYQYPSFAQKHPLIHYADAEGEGVYYVFSAIYTTKINYFINTKLSASILWQEARENGVYAIDTGIRDTDETLTLSTCTRYLGNFADQRFILLARKLRENENPEDFYPITQ